MSVKPPLQVLNVEDNPADAELIVRQLRRYFEPAATRVQSADALRAAMTRQMPDVVLADYKIPGLPFDEVLAIVQLADPDLPVIIVSGTVSEDLGIAMMERGVCDCVDKERLDWLNPVVRREVRDAAHRRNAQKYQRELVLNESRFHDFASSASDWFWETDGDDRFTYLSPGIQTGLGVRPESLIGTARSRLMIEDMKPELVEQHRRVLDDREAFRGALYRVPTDRGVCTISLSGLPVFGPNGDFRGYRGAGADVTHRVLMETALRDSEQRFRVLFDASMIGEVLVDDDDRVILGNSAAAAVFGVDSAVHLIGTSLSQRLRTAEGAAAPLSPGDEPAVFEAEAVRDDDGRAVEVEVRLNRVPWDRGTATLASIIDITERKQVETRLLHAQKKEALGEVVGGVAHDFNNQLTVIGGNLDLLARELSDDSATARKLANAQNAVGRSRQLTQRLLAFARRQVLEPRQLDVNQVVAEMSDMLKMALGDHVSLHIDTAAGVAPVVVDPDQFETCLLNLASNAGDAMGGGGSLTVATEIARVGAGHFAPGSPARRGRYVVVSVTDTGHGMDAEVAARAFDPFFTTKEKGKGTGLGLSTVHGFCQQSGGNATLYSEPGQGTTIRLYFPVSDADPAATEAADTIAAASPGSAPATILVVEDDDDVRETATGILERAGHTVIAAANATDAIALFDGGPAIDLVFTDLMMPGGLSGLDLARFLQDRVPDLPVLIASGYPAQALGANGMLPDGVSFIAKPYSSAELLQALADLFTRGD